MVDSICSSYHAIRCKTGCYSIHELIKTHNIDLTYSNRMTMLCQTTDSIEEQTVSIHNHIGTPRVNGDADHDQQIA